MKKKNSNKGWDTIKVRPADTGPDNGWQRKIGPIRWRHLVTSRKILPANNPSLEKFSKKGKQGKVDRGHNGSGIGRLPTYEGCLHSEVQNCFSITLTFPPNY